jgi:tRNA-specific 2-thiouridylase
VRSEAVRLDLPVAAKPDSQDICFVPSGHYADAVVRLRPDAGEPGDIVDQDGRVRGRHDGIARYTVGQGKRLGAASVVGGRRQTVIALDPARRRVVVGPRNVGTRTVRLRQVNWLILPPDMALACQVNLLAREAPQQATVSLRRAGAGRNLGQEARPWASADAGMSVEAEVLLDAPALPAPGQACVFYDAPSGQARVLGGGFIQSATVKSTTAGVAARGSLAQPSLVEVMRG